jgi:hypothetical protein
VATGSAVAAGLDAVDAEPAETVWSMVPPDAVVTTRVVAPRPVEV